MKTEMQTSIEADLTSRFVWDLPPALADTPTPPPQAGAWTLVAPDGRTWTADQPLRCVAAESRDRVPADVALARIQRAAAEPEALPLMREAFRTCVSDGQERMYEMRFKFKTLADMQAADQEWHAWRKEIDA